MKDKINALVSHVRTLPIKEIAIEKISDPEGNAIAFAGRDVKDKAELKDHFIECQLIHPIVVVQMSKEAETYTLAIGKRRLAGLRDAGKVTAPCKVIERWNQTDVNDKELVHALRSISIIESAFTKPHSDSALFEHFCSLRDTYPGDQKDLWSSFRNSFGITRDNEHYRTIKRMFAASEHDAVRKLHASGLLGMPAVRNEKIVAMVNDAKSYESLQNCLIELQRKLRERDESRKSLADLAKADDYIIALSSLNKVGSSESNHHLEIVKDKPNYPKLEVKEDGQIVALSSYQIDVAKANFQEVLALYWLAKSLAGQMETILKTGASNFKFNKLVFGKEYLGEVARLNMQDHLDIERVFDDLEILSKASRERLKDGHGADYRKKLMDRLKEHCEEQKIVF